MNDTPLILLHDGNAAAMRLGEVLASTLPVKGVNVLDGSERGVPLGSGTVVCFNLATLKKFDIVRKAFGISPEQSVFVVPVFSGEFAPVLRDLGVKDYFVAPVVAEVLWAAVGAARTRSVEAGWQGLPPRQRDSLNASRRTFRGLFDGVRNGGLPDLADLERTSQSLCAMARAESLSHWLSVMRGHHDYTYRHSMFVCGIIVHFAQDMGMTPDCTISARPGFRCAYWTSPIGWTRRRVRKCGNIPDFRATFSRRWTASTGASSPWPYIIMKSSTEPAIPTASAARRSTTSCGSRPLPTSIPP
jgi:hypothetical protein